MAGVKDLRDEDWYGLALVLGGAEMSMEELVTMYAVLPSGGVIRPLRTLLDEPQRAAKKILGKEASFLTLDMLATPRSGDRFRQEWTADDLPVYWKTGTSYGFRDAWTVAVFGPYVLAVWVGNFDGAGNPAFVGRTAAAPLLFEIIDAIKSLAGGLEAPFMDSGEIARVEVCAVSGQLPGPDCPQTVSTWFIPGKSPIKTCEIHREVIIDPATGLRACPGTEMGKKVVYEFWPTDLLKIFKAAGIPRRVPPPYGPGCRLEATAANGIAPEISSPGSGLVYNVRAEAAEDEKIAFTAVSDADSRELYWFVNEKFVGSSESGKPLFWPPEPGKFVVRVVDALGRAAAREIKVVTVQ
jgi:penicillin-binding protein 1C